MRWLPLFLCAAIGLAGCSSGDEDAPDCTTGQSRAYVFTALAFTRELSRGVAAGFDLDDRITSKPEDQTCGFRILLGPAGRDRGFGSEATRLVVAHAFAATDLHRIELEVYAFNPRAQHVYARAGFRVEGRRREAFVFDGERVDAIIMAVLRPEAA